MDSTNLKCSIIIRTKNEERWIKQCLKAIFAQSFTNFEVIIVDNQSTDHTVLKAGEFPIEKVLTVDEYLPGKALNVGIAASKGDYIVCLSAHCIPSDSFWLASLVEVINSNQNVAGCYGRQAPMTFTSPADRRDLLLVFGLDKKVQTNDSFFHNANSIIRRDLWDREPFDETVTNIEDRVWARKMLDAGFEIHYQPKACVYHWHGIHQGGDEHRCAGVVKIIQSLQDFGEDGSVDPGQSETVAFIPFKGSSFDFGGKPLITRTINAALESTSVNRVIVIADDQDVIAIAKEMGAEVPFKRPEYLSETNIGLEEVYQFAIKKLEEHGYLPDVVVALEPTFPFRSPGLIDNAIEKFLASGLDSMVAARLVGDGLWHEPKPGKFERIDSGFGPRSYKERNFTSLKGLVCLSFPEYVRTGRLLGENVGLFAIEDQTSGIEVRDDKSAKIFSPLLSAF